jgi:hypothetical protein
MSIEPYTAIIIALVGVVTYMLYRVRVIEAATDELKKVRAAHRLRMRFVTAPT